jgi:hypothetical protein
MRIQDRQKAVVQYCSEVFNLQAQIMRKHMDISEIVKLAQVDFMNEDPQVVQQALQLIKHPDFLLRCHVESDTLSDIDFQAEKQDRMEYMSTITNYLKEILPTMNSDPIMGPFLMQLLQFSLAGFKVGKKFEAELDRTFNQLQKKLSTPQQPQPSPEQQEVQGKLQLMQAEGQQKAAQGNQKLQQMAAEGQQKLALKAKEAEISQMGKVHDINAKRMAANQKAQADQQALAQNQQHHDQDMQHKVETGAIESQLLKDKFYREEAQSAKEFQQGANLDTNFDRGGKKATGPVV